MWRQGGVIAKLTALPDVNARVREAFQAVYVKCQL